MPGVKDEYGPADNAYLVNHLRRTQAEDFTPYSAQSGVSSFNLPRQYDSNLITPVSMTSSPNITSKADPSFNMEPHIKSSPVALSPTYGLYSPNNEFYPKYDPPMKNRDPVLQISMRDNFFSPGSPFACSSPHYGSFGVSAQSQSVKASEPSPMFHNSPTIQSAGDYSSNGYYSRNQTPALSVSGYKSNSQTPIHVAPGPSNLPILIAPHPSILKPATAKCNPGVHRRNLKPPGQMSRPFRELPEQKCHPIGPVKPSKVQKPSSKKKGKPLPATYEKIMAAAEVHNVSTEEHVLLQLRFRDGLKWADIRRKFNSAFPEKPKGIACLQMKKLRLVERLLEWTDVEVRKERALKMAVEATNSGKWTIIAKRMPEFGSKHKWSAEGCKKHSDELEGKESSSQYERAQLQAENFRRQRTSSSEYTQLSPSRQSWYDGAGSVSHSPFPDLSGDFITALSSANMDDTRSRTASDASVEEQMQQQSIRHIQQQIVYQQRQQLQQPQPQQQRHYSQSRQDQAQQQRHNSWPSGQ